MNPVRCIRTLGRARLLLSIVLALGLAPAARAYELVEVRSGSEIVVVENGERLVLELAGVWAPTPPARDLAAVIGEFWSPLWAPIGPTPDP